MTLLRLSKPIGMTIRVISTLAAILVAYRAAVAGDWLWLPSALAILLMGFGASRFFPFIVARTEGAIPHLKPPQAPQVHEPNELTAFIEIRRPNGPRADRLRSFVVTVDGAPAASIKAGETVRLSVTRGVHRAQCHIDWAASRAIKIRLAAGETAVIQCQSRRLLSAFFCMLFLPSRYVRLRNR